MIWQDARRHIWTPLALGAALLALALAGCGATPASTGAVVPSSTATAAPTATVPFAPTVDAASIPASCASSMMAPSPPMVRVGNLLVSASAQGNQYASSQIPQSAGDKPLALSPSTFAPPPVNPILKDQGGYHFVICNASASQTTTLQSVSVRIASFTASTGALSAWSACPAGVEYDALTKATTPVHCDTPAAPINEEVQASFPANAAVGATVTATQVSARAVTQSDPNPYPALPLSLAPGHSALMVVDVAPPTTPGTYTFAVGLSVDGAAPVYVSTTAPILLAPVAHEWSGQNCMTSAMQAQIPAATQDTYYICPPAA